MSPTYSICREHGYLAGEQYTCPTCGAKTEVYSRITGYYRPVQNWNDGKLQEFENRTEYDIENSERKESVSKVVTVKSEGDKVKVDIASPENIMYLFVTATCPNCKLAKEYLKNEQYVVLDAAENVELVQKYGIMQAPTLVVVNGDSFEKYVNVSNIKKYVEEKSAVTV